MVTVGWTVSFVALRLSLALLVAASDASTVYVIVPSTRVLTSMPLTAQLPATVVAVKGPTVVVPSVALTVTVLESCLVVATRWWSSGWRR